MSGSWAPRTRLNGRDHAASCPLSTSPIVENQGARGTEQPRGKQDGDGTATRKTTSASTKTTNPRARGRPGGSSIGREDPSGTQRGAGAALANCLPKDRVRDGRPQPCTRKLMR